LFLLDAVVLFFLLVVVLLFLLVVIDDRLSAGPRHRSKSLKFLGCLH
jgi:hypothetical protein